MSTMQERATSNARSVVKAGLFVCLAVLMSACSSRNLTSSNSAAMGLMQAPYSNYAEYYGYVDPDGEPDGTYDGKDAHYLYVWVPAAVDEIGVSMQSPAPEEPGDGAFVQSNYQEGMKENPEAWFDTYLALERLKATSPSDISADAGVRMKLEENDDSSEMPANPAGNTYNSLLRVQSSDTPLVRGLYRISFTSFRGEVEGNFVANVGTNVPGVKIAASADKLKEMVQSDG